MKCAFRNQCGNWTQILMQLAKHDNQDCEVGLLHPVCNKESLGVSRNYARSVYGNSDLDFEQNFWRGLSVGHLGRSSLRDLMANGSSNNLLTHRSSSSALMSSRARREKQKTLPDPSTRKSEGVHAPASVMRLRRGDDPLARFVPPLGRAWQRRDSGALVTRFEMGMKE
jgi:hypothetical protein